MIGLPARVELLPRPSPWFRAIAAVLLSLFRVQCQVVLDNTPPTSAGGSTVTDNSWKALIFTSGTSSYRLDSIQLGLNPPTGSSAPGTWNVRVSLFQVALGVPTTEIATLGLVPVVIASATELYTFTPTSSFELAPGTTYALVVASDATGIRWSNRTGSSPTAAGGFAFDGFARTDDIGSNWATSGIGFENAVRLEVTAVPEPAEASAFVASGLVLSAMLFRRHLRQA